MLKSMSRGVVTSASADVIASRSEPAPESFVLLTVHVASNCRDSSSSAVSSTLRSLAPERRRRRESKGRNDEARNGIDDRMAVGDLSG